MIVIKYKKNVLFAHMCMCVCNYVNLENKWFDATEKKYMFTSQTEYLFTQ